MVSETAAETLEGVFTVASEVPKVLVPDGSSESKSVFPVDSPAAKRLKVTSSQHDSIDPTPAQATRTGDSRPPPIPITWILKVSVGDGVRRTSFPAASSPPSTTLSQVSPASFGIPHQHKSLRPSA